MTSPNRPGARDLSKAYTTLRLRHGTAVERCHEAFARLNAEYDPRGWPADPQHQHWAIGHQDDLDAALALIVDLAAGWSEEQVA